MDYVMTQSNSIFPPVDLVAASTTAPSGLQHAVMPSNAASDASRSINTSRLVLTRNKITGRSPMASTLAAADAPSQVRGRKAGNSVPASANQRKIATFTEPQTATETMTASREKQSELTAEAVGGRTNATAYHSGAATETGEKRGPSGLARSYGRPRSQALFRTELCEREAEDSVGSEIEAASDASNAVHDWKDVESASDSDLDSDSGITPACSAGSSGIYNVADKRNKFNSHSGNEIAITLPLQLAARANPQVEPERKKLVRSCSDAVDAQSPSRTDGEPKVTADPSCLMSENASLRAELERLKKENELLRRQPMTKGDNLRSVNDEAGIGFDRRDIQVSGDDENVRGEAAIQTGCPLSLVPSDEARLASDSRSAPVTAPVTTRKAPNYACTASLRSQLVKCIELLKDKKDPAYANADFVALLSQAMNGTCDKDLGVMGVLSTLKPISDDLERRSKSGSWAQYTENAEFMLEYIDNVQAMWIDHYTAISDAQETGIGSDMHGSVSLESGTSQRSKAALAAPDHPYGQPVATIPAKHKKKNAQAKQRRADLKRELAEGDLRCTFRYHCQKPGRWESLETCKRFAFHMLRKFGNTGKTITYAAVWKEYETIMDEEGFSIAQRYICKSCNGLLRAGCCEQYDKQQYVKRYIVTNCQMPEDFRNQPTYGTGPRGKPTIKGGSLRV
ncbi:hypothetical protein HDU88_008009 [Geranomyces variabilis]|nr:hypothetical protein HDU88_008009 [Geranomyces variabilis]